MSRYPKEARGAAVKCISCNAPVVPTVDGGYVCVDCGESPIATDGVASDVVSAGDNDEYTVGQDRPENLAK